MNDDGESSWEVLKKMAHALSENLHNHNYVTSRFQFKNKNIKDNLVMEIHKHPCIKMWFLLEIQNDGKSTIKEQYLFSSFCSLLDSEKWVCASFRATW